MTDPLFSSQGVPPPAAGEVVAWLLEKAVQAADADQPKAAGMLTWAAQVIGEQSDSLERQQPQPVPMLERPWDRDGWCDEQGRCWIYINFDDGWHIPCWKLARPSEYDWKAVRRGEPCFSLPANALPLPSRETPGNKGSECSLSEFGPNDMPLG